MIRKKLIVRAEGTDPYENLALEQELMSLKDTAVLYLWQNAHTIVIGRNQDAFAECRVGDLLASGGRIARRRTGGGAVYHDLGNLNYTLILPSEDFDIPGQMAMVSRALEKAGIPGAEWNGRNDLVVNGRKCSGNAFQMTKTAGCHHGTILIDTDGNALSRYLTPEKSKLLKHGIQSVSSRVVNLKELLPDLAVEKVCAALTGAFEDKYGAAEFFSAKQLDSERLKNGTAFLQSEQWLYPERGEAPKVVAARFPWGSFRACLDMEDGCISRAVFYTDALDAELFPKAAEQLRGHRTDEARDVFSEAFSGASSERKQMLSDISACLAG